MTSPRVLTQPLGGTRLARALLARETPAGWVPRVPASPQEWLARLQSLRSDDAVVRAFASLNPAFGEGGAPGAGTAAARRLDASRDGRGAVVTTGQQPGLFGGPVYTWTKALSALALADALQEATGIPVAPVFWAATDDADFEEARSTVVAVPGGVERLALPDATKDGIPMAMMPLGNATPLIDRLAAGAGSVAFPEALHAVRRAYETAGATVGSAYVALLRGILEPLGIVVLDASHPAVRQAMHPVMTRALQRAGPVDAALRARTAEIQAATFEPQVALVPKLTLVSRMAPEGKLRVSHGDASDLAREAEAGSLSPTVLLRPVAERVILPTAAYLAGPGEMAYFAQVAAVAGALELTPPLALPRWSCTIIEPHIDRILERHGVVPDELARENGPESRLAREAMPGPAMRALRDLREAVDRSASELDHAARVDGKPFVDPQVIEGATTALHHRVDRLERRLVAGVTRRSVQLRGDLATARAALYPEGKAQERALNFIPMLARHGTPLLLEMIRQALVHARQLVGGVGIDGAKSPATAVRFTGADEQVDDG